MTMDNGAAQAAADLASAESAEDQTFPEWEANWDAAGVPDLMRPTLREQVRKSDANAKKAIETARGGGVDPEWQAFIGQAREGGVAPTDLVDAWNAAQAIREDPQAFLREFGAEVDKLVKSGQLTALEGQQAKAEGQEQVIEALDGDTPEMKRIAELQARLDAKEARDNQRDQEQTQAFEDQQMQVEAQAYATQFFTDLDGALDTAGYSAVKGTLNESIRANVARVADGIIQGDATNTVTPQRAIELAIENLVQISGGPRVLPGITPAAPATQQQFPVGGGRGAPMAAAPEKFDMSTREGQKADRDARMARALAEAERQKDAGIEQTVY